MEELFQLILALFVLSFPLLSILSRRRQAGRTRRAESRSPRAGRWRRRGRRGGEAADGGEDVAAGAEGGELTGSGADEPQGTRRGEGTERGGRMQRGGPAGREGRSRAEGASAASSRPRQTADATMSSEIRRGGPTVVSAGRSRLQQAVIWAEVLGKPKALRRTSDPWDDEGSL